MAQDVIITPADGEIEWQDNTTGVALIDIDANNNLSITNAGGNLSIGDGSSDVYIGNGIANVDLVFEQDGEIRGTGSQTLTLGTSGDTIKIAGGTTFSVQTDLSFAANPEITWTSNFLDLYSTNAIGVVRILGNASYAPRFEIYTDAGTTKRIMLDPGSSSYLDGANAKLGIGIASPTAPLTIRSTTIPQVVMGYPTGTNEHRFYWDSSKVYLSADHNNNVSNSGMLFAINGSTFLQGDDNGDVLVSNNLGIGTTSPGAKLHVYGGTSAFTNMADNTDSVQITRNASVHTHQDAKLFIYDNSNADWGQIVRLGGSSSYGLKVDQWVDYGFALFQQTIGQVFAARTSSIVINEDGGNYDFRVEGDTDTSLLVCDASADRVGIGFSSPSYKLHVNGDASAVTLLSDYRRLRSSGNFTTSTSNTAGWYPLAKWGTSSGNRGGFIIYVSYTGGSWGPTTYVIKVFKDWGGTGTILVEKYGGNNYITDVRIIADSSSVYHLELYLISQTAGHSFDVRYEGMGYDESGTSTMILANTSLALSTNTGTVAASMNLGMGQGLATTNALVRDNLYLGSRMYHHGDNDTYLGFNTNETFLVAGSINGLHLYSTEVVVNENQANLDFRVESDSSVNLLVCDASTDRVGIGTNSPSYKLHVVGNSYIDATSANPTLTLGRYSGQPTVQAGSDDGGYLIMDSNGAYAALNWYSGNPIALGVGGGNVGINTTRAGIAKLQIRTDSAAYPTNAAASGLSGLTIFGTDGNMDLLSIDDNSTVANSISFGRYVNTNNGALIHKFGIVHWCNTGSTGSNTGDRLAFHYGTNRNPWDSTELVTIEAGGSVGIGTDNPSEKLHVAGDIRIGVGGASDYNRIEFTRNNGALVGGMGWHSSGYFYVAGHPDLGPGAGNIVRVYGFGSDLRLGDSTWGDVLTIDNTNGYVGIGTTSPSYKLDVLSGTTPVARFQGATNAYSDFTDGTINYRIQVSGDAYIGTTSNHKLHLKTNNSGRVTIDTGGNVGIGTTSPAQKLNITDGGILMTDENSGQPMFQARNFATSATGTFNNTYGFEYRHASSGTQIHGALIHLNENVNSRIALTVSSSFGTVAQFTSAGYVGIGTGSPEARMQVVTTSDTSGTPTSYDGKYFTVGQGGTTSGNVFISYDNTNNRGYIGALSPSVAWRNLILNPGGGSVGVGITTPLTNSKMTVNGRFAVGNASYGSNMNNGNADFSVDCDGTPQISWISNYLQIGGTNQNWNMRMYNGQIQTYSNDLYVQAGGTGTTYRLYLGTNGQAQTITCQNGNVGMGSTVPTEKLYVNGNIALSSTSYKIGYRDTSAMDVYIQFDDNNPSYSIAGTTWSTGGGIKVVADKSTAADGNSFVTTEVLDVHGITAIDGEFSDDLEVNGSIGVGGNLTTSRVVTITNISSTERPAIKIVNPNFSSNTSSTGKTFYRWLPIDIDGTTRWIAIYS